MTPEQVEQIIEYLAKSPFVQSEVEAAKVAIFSFAEAEAKRAIPYGLGTISRILRWIYKKCKRKCFNMAGTATITVNDGTKVLEGATVSYVVNNVTCEATTDSTGVATVTGLDAGNYDFTAVLSGYASASVTLAIIDDTTTAGIISLTAETTTTTTEAASTTSTATTTEDVKSAAETAAATTIINSITSGATEFINDLIDAGETEADRLEAEIKTTSDLWVKARNKMEAVAIRALIAAVKAGEVAAVVLLAQKLKDKLD